MSSVKDILDNDAAQLANSIDESILFDLLTEGWHKMEITFNKDRYHQIIDMEDWCHKHIGKGGWVWGSPSTWEGLDGKIWVMHSAFGNTTFAFKEQKHYTWFILRWT